MEPISKSERRGLTQMQAKDVQHPDADLLSAFAEQALTAREREQVMSHLSVCSNCREVVSFAAPEVVRDAPVFEPARKAAWWSLSSMRWAVAAATAAVVVAVVGVSSFMNHQVAPQKSTPGYVDTRSNLAKAMPAQSATGQDQVSAAPAVGGTSGIQREQIRYEKIQAKGDQPVMEAKKEQRYISPPATAQPGTSFDAMAGSANSNMASGLPVPEMTLADKMMARADRDSKDVAATDVAATAESNVVAAAPPPPQAPGRAKVAGSSSGRLHWEGQADETQLAKAKAEDDGQFANRYNMMERRGSLAAGAAPAKQAAPVQKSIISSQWRVANGFLQASPDTGQSWVNVLPQFKFNNVQNVGNEVWASGPNSLLMHSFDHGLTWRRVIPRQDTVAMTGDVSSINATDSLYLTIKTSTGETWITTDGGKTWTKQ